MSILQLSDLELYLQKDIAGTTDEDKYSYLIESVQSQAESICHHKFDLQEYTEIYDGNGGNELSLNNYPVTTVSEVLYGWVWSGSSRTEITSDNYLVYNDIGTLAFNFNSTDDGNQLFNITYTAGWTDADPSSSSNAPTDLKTILMNEIESQKNKSFTSGDIKKQKLGDYSWEKFTDAEKEGTSAFEDKLKKYVRSDI